MVKNLLIVIIGSLLIASCGNEKKEMSSKKLSGGVYQGGILNCNEVVELRTLYPHQSSEEISTRIQRNMFEGLVKFNQKDLTVIPALASSWSVTPDGLTYTFNLRKGIKFHNNACFANNKGREVTANDFKYCFDRLCTNLPDNQGYWIFLDIIKGAQNHFNANQTNTKNDGVSGIKVIDNYTLKIELLHPSSGFLNKLCMPFTAVFPKEAIDKYGDDIRTNPVGTGPFKLKEMREGEIIILQRNETYWEKDENGNQLPYLDAVKISFIKEKKAELLEFKKGNLDLIFKLPLEMITDIGKEIEENKAGAKPKFDIQVQAGAATMFYGFLHTSDIFKNKLIRQAFNYAIDRESLVAFTLQGDGQPANLGLVPPCFNTFNANKVKGYTFNKEKAQKLLAQAGYPGGKGFPELKLNLNSGGSINTHVAEVIQKMLNENLGLDIKINITPFAQHVENFESGNYLFWKGGWVADYPDAENFLNILYSKTLPKDLTQRTSINNYRYISPKFDSLFLAAEKEVDPKKREEYLIKADQTQIDDAALMPLYYQEYTRLVQLKVKGLVQNAMELRDLSRVYIEPSITEK